jgi:hypothetical protein
LDQEEKMTASQKVLEMDTQLAELTSSGRALCDIVLGAGQGMPR